MDDMDIIDIMEGVSGRDDMDDDDDDDDMKVHRMLGDMSPAQFALLPKERREAVFRDYLVKDGEHVFVDSYWDCDDDRNAEIADGALLRQSDVMGSDEAGKQLVREAQEIYFGENTFLVASSCLDEFGQDSLGDREPVDIQHLVRMLMIQVDVEDWRDDCSDNGEEDPFVVKDLQELFKFTNAEAIVLFVAGGVAPDGSDLKTQLKFKDMSGIVKELLDKFGDRIRIHHGSSPGGRWHDIGKYWNPLSAGAQRRLRDGKCSFTELMQIQIEEWTSPR